MLIKFLGLITFLPYAVFYRYIQFFQHKDKNTFALED